MLIMGVIGYFLIKLGFSMPPIILGLVLGTLAEKNARRGLDILAGTDSVWDHPIAYQNAAPGIRLLPIEIQRGDFQLCNFGHQPETAFILRLTIHTFLCHKSLRLFSRSCSLCSLPDYGCDWLFPD